MYCMYIWEVLFPTLTKNNIRKNRIYIIDRCFPLIQHNLPSTTVNLCFVELLNLEYYNFDVYVLINNHGLTVKSVGRLHSWSEYLPMTYRSLISGFRQCQVSIGKPRVNSLLSVYLSSVVTECDRCNIFSPEVTLCSV